MSFDYFYGQQSDLFTFYRVPKVLFTNERFWNISADAKMLIVRSLAEQNGMTEQLKAENQMEWVRQMNACKAQAEEIAGRPAYHRRMRRSVC